MDIKFFREDDGTFGAKVTVENEIIFGQGDTMEALWADITEGLECAFDQNQSNHVTIVKQPLESMIQFFITHPRSHATQL